MTSVDGSNRLRSFPSTRVSPPKMRARVLFHHPPHPRRHLLTNMQGLISADLDRKRVVLRADTRTGDIGRALKEIGLSLANQGDIDTQAIAGALSTGTHATGLSFGCLSSQAVGMRLVQPDGSVFDRRPRSGDFSCANGAAVDGRNAQKAAIPQTPGERINSTRSPRSADGRSKPTEIIRFHIFSWPQPSRCLAGLTRGVPQSGPVSPSTQSSPSRAPEPSGRL